VVVIGLVTLQLNSHCPKSCQVGQLIYIPHCDGQVPLMKCQPAQGCVRYTAKWLQLPQRLSTWHISSVPHQSLGRLDSEEFQTPRGGHQVQEQLGCPVQFTIKEQDSRVCAATRLLCPPLPALPVLLMEFKSAPVPQVLCECYFQRARAVWYLETV
jgi:hypothetical protein